MKKYSPFLESSDTYQGTVKQVSDIANSTEYPTIIEIEIDGKTKYIKPWLSERLPRESAVEVVIIDPEGYAEFIVYPR